MQKTITDRVPEEGIRNEKTFRVTNRHTHIFQCILFFLLAIEFCVVVHCGITYSLRKENARLRNLVKQLQSKTCKKEEGSSPIKALLDPPPTPVPETIFPRKFINNSASKARALVVDLSGIKLTDWSEVNGNLPFINSILGRLAQVGRLKENDVCVTFVVNGDQINSRKPKIVEQIESHCHEIAFKGKVPSWAKPTAPIMAENDKAGLSPSTIKNHPYFTFNRRIDLRGANGKDLLEASTSGEIVFIDLIENPNARKVIGPDIQDVNLTSIGNLLDLKPQIGRERTTHRGRYS